MEILGKLRKMQWRPRYRETRTEEAPKPHLPVTALEPYLSSH